MQTRLNFSLTQIEYVLALHRLGHFAKAAEACHVTQPTLSMQIQKLEDSLGVVLFDRSKKPILPTAVGEDLIKQMQNVLYEANKIEFLIDRRSKNEISGKLALGVIPTIAPYLLPKLLPVIENIFPDIEIKISEMQTHRIVEALDADQIDVGLLATPLEISGVFEQFLFFDPFYVLCNGNHSLADSKRIRQSMLKNDDIWLLEEGHCLRNQVVDVCRPRRATERKRSFEFESGSLETLKNLVDSYGGYTLLPALAAERIGASSRLISFERPIPAREIGLVFQRKHHKANLIESLGKAILESLPDSLRKIRKADLDILPIA